VVVDNKSSGNDVAVLKEKFGGSIYLIANDKNLGFPGGVNVGIKDAQLRNADYLLLLNNDVTVDADFVYEMVRLAESDETIGVMGSKIYYYDYPNIIQSAGGTINWWIGYIKLYGGGEEDKGQLDQTAERDYVWGTSIMIPSKVVEKIGYFDPHFFFGVEEYDYCTRAKRAGFKVMYVAKSKVWHKLGASRAKLPKFPETQALIKNERGFNNSKFYYHLYKTYCPPILFLFPLFVCTILRPELIARFFRRVRNGEWGYLFNVLQQRIKKLFTGKRKP
jgi:GT2 family glycosyltransferase